MAKDLENLRTKDALNLLAPCCVILSHCGESSHVYSKASQFVAVD